MRKSSAALLLFLVVGLFAHSAPAVASSAACETIIWGNRLAADATAAAGLVPMVNLETEAGAAWYAEVNALLARSSRKLEALLAAAPTEPGATFTPSVEVDRP